MALKIIFDLLLCAIMVAGAVYGIKYGFIRLAAKPLKFIAALSFSLLACKGIAKAIIAPLLQAPVTNYIKDFMYSNCPNLTVENASTELPTLLKIAGAVFDVDIAVATADVKVSVLDSIINALTSPVVSVISIAIAFLALFFLAKLLFSVGVSVVNSVFKSGVLGKINQAMGFVLATTLAFVLAWTFAVVAEFFFNLPIFENSEAIKEFGNGGFIYRLFKSLNPLELLLSF